MGAQGFAKTLTDLSEGDAQQEKAFSGNISEEDYFKIIYCKPHLYLNFPALRLPKARCPPEFFLPLPITARL